MTTSQWAFSWQLTGPSRFSQLKHWGKPGQCPICTEVVPQRMIAEHWGAHFNMRQCGDCEVRAFLCRLRTVADWRGRPWCGLPNGSSTSVSTSSASLSVHGAKCRLRRRTVFASISAECTAASRRRAHVELCGGSRHCCARLGRPVPQVVLETDMHAHMKSCPAHDLRLKYFWDVFSVVDEDTGELDNCKAVARPYTAQEYCILP